MLLLARGDKHLRSPIFCNLKTHVTRCAEAVDAQPVTFANTSKTQTAKADDPRAQQGRGLKIGEALRDRIDKVFVSQGVLGVPAVHGVARELRSIAEVLASAQAVEAFSAGLVQPGNTDARAASKFPRARA